MVDTAAYRKIHSQTLSILRRHAEDQLLPENIKELKEDVGPLGDGLYLFSSQVVGFNHRLRKWSMFNPTFRFSILFPLTMNKLMSRST